MVGTTSAPARAAIPAVPAVESVPPPAVSTALPAADPRSKSATVVTPGANEFVSTIRPATAMRLARAPGAPARIGTCTVTSAMFHHSELLFCWSNVSVHAQAVNGCDVRAAILITLAQSRNG